MPFSSLQVCEKEGVPLNVVPLTDQYWDRVVADSISEIKRGRTPNPDILCNSRQVFPSTRTKPNSSVEIHTNRSPFQFPPVIPVSAACRVKFGAFYEFLESDGGHDFDRVASGHYARIIREEGGEEVQLALTPDANKDQTYFLAHLSQQQLSKAMFPLGNLTKVGGSAFPVPITCPPSVCWYR